MYLSHKNNTGLISANPNDLCWIPLEDGPITNGWYDVCVRKMSGKSSETEYILSLGLYRDGEWLDLPFKDACIGYKLPLKLKDDKNQKINDFDAAIALAQSLLEDARSQFMSAFTELITADSMHALQTIENYLAVNRRAFNTDVISAILPSGVDSDEIIRSLCIEVLIKHDIPTESAAKARRLIHGACDWYKNQFIDCGCGFDVDRSMKKISDRKLLTAWNSLRNDCGQKAYIRSLAEKRSKQIQECAAIAACVQIKRIMRRYRKVKIKTKKNVPMKKKNTIGIPRKVKCIETGEIFDSVQLAASIYKGNKSSLSHCLRGIHHTFKGMHWEYA